MTVIWDHMLVCGVALQRLRNVACNKSCVKLPKVMKKPSSDPLGCCPQDRLEISLISEKLVV